MNRFLAPVVTGLLGVFASTGVAQERALPDSVLLDLLSRGKPPVRTFAASWGGRDPGRIGVRDSVGRVRSDESIWPNLGAPKDGGRPVLWLFGGLTASDFPQLESVACDQVAILSCSVDRFSFGPRIGAIWWPWSGTPIGVGLSGGRSSLSVTQAWDVSPFPDRVVTDLDVYTATAFVDAWHHLSQGTRVIGTLGFVWAWNRARITEFFPSETVVTHRRDDGGRWTVGAALERDLATKTRLRFEYRFIDGEAGDADRQHQFALLFGWSPGGRAPRAGSGPPSFSGTPRPRATPPGATPAPTPPSGRRPIPFPVGEPTIGGPPDPGTGWPGEDDDRDGVLNEDDACPMSPAVYDPDGDGCEGPGRPDGDDDGDGLRNDRDACPLEPAGYDPDRDGCPGPGRPDGDDDDDGVRNDRDACPFEPAGYDPDGDGCPGPGTPDGDDDGDGVPTGVDRCPRSAPSYDPDGDGCQGPGLDPDGDADGDGVRNADDACPLQAAGYDTDGDGCPGPGDPNGDPDGDGVVNVDDACPLLHARNDPDGDGCPGPVDDPDGDADGDGVRNIDDECPSIPAWNDPDRDGCPGPVVDPDGDRDGDDIRNIDDRCPDLHAGDDPDGDGCPGTRGGGGGGTGAEETGSGGTGGGETSDEGTGGGTGGEETPDDGDPVTPPLELCPGTPPGLPVDSRGCPGIGGEVAAALPLGTFDFAPPAEPVLAGRPVTLVFRVTPANRDSVDPAALRGAIEEYVERTGSRDTIYLDVDSNRIADRLTARLSVPEGTDWSIEPDSGRTFTISRDGPTEWQWDVTPQCRVGSRLSLSRRCQDGLVSLHVGAQTDVDGGPIAWQPTVEPVGVRVTTWGALRRFGGLNWWWLWILLAGPFVARRVTDGERRKPPRVRVRKPPITSVVPLPAEKGTFEDVGDVLDGLEQISVPDAGVQEVDAEDPIDESREIVHRPVMDPGHPSVERPDGLIDEDHVTVERPSSEDGAEDDEPEE